VIRARWSAIERRIREPRGGDGWLKEGWSTARRFGEGEGEEACVGGAGAMAAGWIRWRVVS
jgi:hypothetical protein